MTTQELIEQLRSDAHYLANDEIAFNAVISTRIDLAADYIKALETQLVAVTAERDKAVEFIKYLDRNYSSYMSEEEKFSKWRGLENESKTAEQALKERTTV